MQPKLTCTKIKISTISLELKFCSNQFIFGVDIFNGILVILIEISVDQHFFTNHINYLFPTSTFLTKHVTAFYIQPQHFKNAFKPKCLKLIQTGSQLPDM